jgi:hypothetical protein
MDKNKNAFVFTLRDKQNKERECKGCANLKVISLIYFSFFKIFFDLNLVLNVNWITNNWITNISGVLFF